MNKKLFIYFAFLFQSIVLFAQTDKQTLDSTQNIKDLPTILPTISVLGTRSSDFAAGNRVISIDTKLLKANTTANLADIISLYAPAYVRSYGSGMLATVAFRGTSSNHSAVLWNGFNISLPTLGMSDFNILPVLPNSNIQIQLGAASSNYGTGAIGGVILLNNNLKFNTPQTSSLQQEIGSFGLSKTVLQAVASSEKIVAQISFSRIVLANDFEFVNKNRFGFPTEKQENAATQQISIAQDLLFKLNSTSNLSIKLWNTENYRQIQPAIGTRNDQAKQIDNNFRLMGEYAKSGKLIPKTHGMSYNLKVRAAFFNDVLNFESDVVALSRSTVQTAQTQIENTFLFHGKSYGKSQEKFGDKLALQTGIDFQHFTADVDGYGTASKIEKRSSVFALLRYRPNDKLNITANFRQAFVEGFNPNPTPSFGVDYRAISFAKHLITLKTSISAAYRVPTLNERFWKSGGNPNIKPESATNMEIGLLHQFIGENLNLENSITVYKSVVDNWILWKQGTNFWSPENVLQVEAKGIEISTKLRYQYKSFSILSGLQYQFTQSIQLKSVLPEEQNKQLTFIPLHSAGVFALVQYRNYLLNFNTNYAGKRFTTTDNSDFLPNYYLTNLSLGYQYMLKKFVENEFKSENAMSFAIWFRVYNLTNETYQTMVSRAMPLRNYAISLQISF